MKSNLPGFSLSVMRRCFKARAKFSFSQILSCFVCRTVFPLCGLKRAPFPSQNALCFLVKAQWTVCEPTFGQCSLPWTIYFYTNSIISFVLNFKMLWYQPSHFVLLQYTLGYSNVWVFKGLNFKIIFPK